MEYAKGKKFAADFVTRTKYNLEQIKDTPYDVTQLINSLVGLLIIPREYGFSYINDELISTSIKTDVFTCVMTNTYPEGTNIKEILRHMKNAVSHSRIEFHVDKPGITALVQDIEFVEFKDRKKGKNGDNYEFCMIISVDLLRRFLYEFSDAVSKLNVVENAPALSLLEHQKTPVSDFEPNALTDILDVSVDRLLGRSE